MFLSLLLRHGLESGPKGKKVLELQRILGKDRVYCVDMQVSLYDVRRRNSLLRAVLFGLVQPWRWTKLFSSSAHDVLENCVNIQEQAIEEFKPDVVIGSSWGGAVATLCLSRGIWGGPTILLAPALARVLEKFGDTPPHLCYESVIDSLKKKRSGGRCGKVLIVHGTEDKTIPIDDSLRMASSGIESMECLEVHAGDHSLNRHLILEEKFAEHIEKVWGKSILNSKAKNG